LSAVILTPTNAVDGRNNYTAYTVLNTNTTYRFSGSPNGK